MSFGQQPSIGPIVLALGFFGFVHFLSALFLFCFCGCFFAPSLVFQLFLFFFSSIFCCFSLFAFFCYCLQAPLRLLRFFLWIFGASYILGWMGPIYSLAFRDNRGVLVYACVVQFSVLTLRFWERILERKKETPRNRTQQHICVYVCVYAYLYIYICMYVCVFAQIFVLVCVCTDTCLFMCLR